MGFEQPVNALTLALPAERHSTAVVEQLTIVLLAIAAAEEETIKIK